MVTKAWSAAALAASARGPRERAALLREGVGFWGCCTSRLYRSQLASNRGIDGTAWPTSAGGRLGRLGRSSCQPF